MNSPEAENIHSSRKMRIQASIWLASSLVVLLILLFSFTIRHARERDMIDQYGKQQTVIAKGAAASVEDLLRNIQKNLFVLAKMPSVKKLRPRETVESMKVIHDSLERNVTWIARLDEKGLILSGYPSVVAEMVGMDLSDRPFFQAAETDRGPYIGAGDLISTDGGEKQTTLMISVPKFNAANNFSGIILAAVPFSVILDLCNRASVESITHEFWLLDKDGRFLAHPDGRRVGTSADFRPGFKKQTASETFLDAVADRNEGSGEYLVPNEQGKTGRAILSYAPIRMGREYWTVVFVTSHEKVTSLFHVTFVNFLFGSLALIGVVVVLSGVIARRIIKGMRVQEELKRLRERDHWLEALLHEKKTMEGIVEGSPIPTFVLDKDHKVILWNRACAELTGYGAHDMVGKKHQYLPFYAESRPVIADLILERDIEGLNKYYGTKMIRASQTIQGAFEARDFYENLGGRKRYLYFLAAPIYDEKGQMIAAIETLQDMSREEEMAKNLQEYAKTIHEELLENIRLRKKLGSLYDYLSSVVESLPDELYEIGEDGMARCVGGDAAPAQSDREGRGAMPLAALFSPEHRDFVVAKWQEAKRGQLSPYEIEERGDGVAKRDLLITMTPIKGSGSHLLVVRNITEFKNLEKMYYESQKLAAVGQLSAGIAHEVRNPLSSIKMSLQILEKRMKPQGNDLKRFQIARREVEHLEQLVKDVLVFAKPSAPRKEAVDVRKILESALAMAEKHLSERNVRIETSFEEGLPFVDADAGMMEQAFLNVCLNAVDAMTPDGTLRISAVRGTDGRTVVIEIEDDGCGIDEADLPHVFNPFFTKKQYGTGLGLTQVKKIVEMHGGSVNIVSREGAGCRVVITVPQAGD